MDCSRSFSGEGERQTVSQNQNADNERQWQQERLNREEAYYQFINELNDEDYRLMRDHNLLGTPGEITADELQQRLQGAKEHLASQSDPENRDWERVSLGYSETFGENSTNNSLLEWLNTFHQSGNSTHSGQSGNQSWRSISRANPNSREFRFSLEININQEHNGGNAPGQELNSILYDQANQRQTESNSLIIDSPVASRTRSRTLRDTVSRALASSRAANASGSVTQYVEESSQFFARRPRRRNRRSASLATRYFLDDNEHNIIRQSRTHRVTSVRLHRGRTRTRSQRNTRQRPAVLRLRSTFSSQFHSLLERRQDMNVQQIHTPSSRTHTVQSSPEQGEEQSPSLGISMGEDESTGTQTAPRRQPTITLDLQFRRIHAGENRDQDSIATRTRSRAGLADNLVTFENNNEGFPRTVSRSERAGIRTYVSTVRIPLRRISEAGLGESSAAALRSILRQIMTRFEELNHLIDPDSNSRVQRGSQHLSAMQSQLSNLHTLSNVSEFNETSLQNGPAEQGSRDWHGEINAAQHYSQGNETQENRGFQDATPFVENGTLPILRLVPYLLLEEDSGNHLRGLTKDQIDNLSTRNYGNASSEDSEISKTCSVCINEYVVGNKLRQLPCMHEFHFHCIDRWLSENSTCPICRQPVVP
ncbi:E3 ubiquitin-protein ligase RNF6 [Varanus komodoensis]|uniref:RING-type E3 ubiquitin transferase n=1 Tax=Varanus komodoensis TaxID=61221 RepID=A0A8D2KVD4_VARKO|nr:E3 ubiquitin-protein ligase RNF6 [Varanus komodoensis]XP_044298396.1 E3 ubiquitin-protein ligase RNF6 [Varanus komodoensis]XP_044298397.1 E3 ubiquitin-protein ligase RNF6 [Varanus komodoensis]XP_044298398.1 E3 ubiquitin-protein ligase RNF6 [Varanus komodoensis]XP_044298399.1 E3 ubiquitin-protein ligase RNF6 [Varanus komodoensis]XP_044298401.1 E3 ubiquitin-protein ligase RNF6 [Varanus komodoensis]